MTTPIFIGTRPLLNFQLPYPITNLNNGEKNSTMKPNSVDQEIHAPSAPPPEALSNYSSPNSSQQPDIGEHNLDLLPFRYLKINYSEKIVILFYFF